VLLTRLSSRVCEENLSGHGFEQTLCKPVLTPRLAALLAGETLLPLAPLVAASPSTPAPVVLDDAGEPVVDTTGGPRILLAEDNPFNQKVATAMLRLLGCRVRVAATGVEALTMAREGNVDLVLMDCQMPVMDGYEATRRIRDLPAPAGAVTIIAMTANALSGDRKACFAAGMDDFLSKPITKAMLADMMRKWEIVGKSEPQSVSGQAERAVEPVDAPAL
jgi:CheY-like chemotaxis protein